MSTNYTYLFPYEKIPQGSRIVIYGAGDVGQHYLKQILITNYAKVIGFVDKNYDKYNNFVVPVYSPANVNELNFDFIVLALKREDYVYEITDRLVKLGVKRDKIIYKGIRNINIPIGIEKENALNVSLAYDKASISVALKYGPGLGDAIIKKALVMEIVKMLPEALIDIYAPGGSDFIPSLYSDMKEFNCAVDDGGGQYVENKNKYTVAMSVFRMIEVDYINFPILESNNSPFAEAMRKHIDNHNKYKLSNFPATQNYIHYGRAKFKGWNIYSLYQYTDVFFAERNQIEIPLDYHRSDVLNDSNSSRYITINYGNGGGGKGYKENTSKQWPLSYFNEFVRLFKDTYADIKVTQVGDSTTEKIENVDNYFLGRDLEEVKWILKGAIFHVDIEGGLVHLATNLGTKCIVLFGATQVDIYSYPQNINIVSPKCNGCYALYENGYACARGLDKPECMYSITPEMVMDRIKKYFG